MEYGKFMARLAKGGAGRAYILAGAEDFFISRAERAIVRALVPDEAARSTSVSVLDGDPDTASLVGLMGTVPFFSPMSVLIVRGSKIFAARRGDADEKSKTKKKRTDKNMEQLTAMLLDMPETNAVIFEMTAKADKRKKVVKSLDAAGCVLDADPVRPWTIGEWLRGELSETGCVMDREANAYFMSAVSMMNPISLSFLDRELRKIAMYKEAEAKDSAEKLAAIKEKTAMTAAEKAAVKSGSLTKKITKKDLEDVFSTVPEVSGFALLDAISAKDSRTALLILERELDDGTYLPLIIASLARHVRQLLTARLLMARGTKTRDLGKALGINPYIGEKLGAAARAFKEEKLKAAIIAIADADYLLKTGGAGPEILEHIVIVLCH